MPPNPLAIFIRHDSDLSSGQSGQFKYINEEISADASNDNKNPEPSF